MGGFADGRHRLAGKAFCRIEQGAQWPQQTRWGKAFVLSKVEGVTTDPMDFRTLLIMPRLYRRWAGLRLHDLVPWVNSGQLQEMYAGVPGGGAEMAWWHAGITRDRSVP